MGVRARVSTLLPAESGSSLVDGDVLSVTAGNWLSQHGGRSSTRRETVLPRRQKPYPPVCCLHRVVKWPSRVTGRGNHTAPSRAPSPPPPAVAPQRRRGLLLWLGDSQRFAQNSRIQYNDGATHARGIPRRCRRRRRCPRRTELLRAQRAAAARAVRVLDSAGGVPCTSDTPSVRSMARACGNLLRRSDSGRAELRRLAHTRILASRRLLPRPGHRRHSGGPIRRNVRHAKHACGGA